MNIKECLEKGLLKKDIKSIERAKKSVEIAEHKLDIAKRVFDIEIFDDSIINAYSVMFHAARALLFKDGYRENSHYGLYVYISEKYKDKIGLKFVNELNALRLERHELAYGLEKSDIKEIEAENIISVAGEFLKIVKRLVK